MNANPSHNSAPATIPAFKVGDRVRFIYKDNLFKDLLGVCGTVCLYSLDTNSILVRFDKSFAAGHGGDTDTREQAYRWFNSANSPSGQPSALELVESEPVSTASLAHANCAHISGSTLLMGWTICKLCGENLKKVGY